MSIIKNCPKCDILFDASSKWGERKFCSRKCANSRGPMSEPDKELRRVFSIEHPTGVAVDHSLRGDTRIEKVSIVCPTCETTFDTLPSAIRIYCSSTCRKSGGFRENSTIKHRSIYKGFQMDSGAELTFAKLLDQYNIIWIKNNSTFFEFIGSDQKQHRYYPDFYLPSFDYWIEIKGRKYIRIDDDLRLKAVGNNIQLIMSHEICLPTCIGDHTENRTPVS